MVHTNIIATALTYKVKGYSLDCLGKSAVQSCRFSVLEKLDEALHLRSYYHAHK